MVFLVILTVYYGLGTISGLAFNSWTRDLIPDHIRGAFGGRRLAIAMAVGAVLTLAAGFGVDLWKRYAETEIVIYSLYYTAAGVVGLLGTWYLSRIPEPAMPPRQPESVWAILREPLQDHNFRQLLHFLGSWNFATNLAAPFFTVYMLKRPGLDMSIIVALAVASQFTNVLFLQLWGRLGDRFSNKSVLTDAGHLFILATLLWPFTTAPEVYAFTIPLLIAIHVLSGMSTAGVTLASANIALKLAPKGRATAYLATSAMVSGVAAFVAPVLGGLAAIWLEGQELNLDLRWLSAGETVGKLTAVSLRGLDFLFILSFLFGLYALHRLFAVKETGEVEKGVVFQQVRAEVRKAVTSISNVAGMPDLFYFPYARLREIRRRRVEENSAQSTSEDAGVP